MTHIQTPGQQHPNLPPHTVDTYLLIFRPTGGLVFNSYTCFFTFFTAKTLISRFVGCDPTRRTRPQYSLTRYNPQSSTIRYNLFTQEIYDLALAAGVYRLPPSSNEGASRWACSFSQPITCKGFTWQNTDGETLCIPAREDFTIVPARLSLELHPDNFNEPDSTSIHLAPIRL